VKRDAATSAFLRLVGVGSNLHADNVVGIVDRAVLVGIALLDGVDVLHAGRDLAEDGVLAVEERRRLEADEKLAVAAVGIAGARQAQRAALEMRALAELRLDVVAGAAGTVALGIAGLRHEAGDHAMEGEPVIEAA